MVHDINLQKHECPLKDYCQEMMVQIQCVLSQYRQIFWPTTFLLQAAVSNSSPAGDDEEEEHHKLKIGWKHQRSVADLLRKKPTAETKQSALPGE